MTIFQLKSIFSLTGVLKIKKKKLVLTLFSCVGQETWLDNSENLIT